MRRNTSSKQLRIKIMIYWRRVTWIHRKSEIMVGPSKNAQTSSQTGRHIINPWLSNRV